MIRVSCAIIRNEENEILVVQRGEKTDHPFKWEFPGGKIEKGETEEESIIREIAEELGLDIVIRDSMHEVEYNYGKKAVRLLPFICDTLEEIPLLTEHVAFRWLKPSELLSVDYSEADILVAGQYLENLERVKSDVETCSETELPSEDDKGLKEMVSRLMGRQEADWIAISATENPAIFRKLIDYSFLADKKLAFRASWTLSKACEIFPEMIYPYMPRLIEGLEALDNESTRRSFLRIISISEIGKLDSRYHGILADHCFKALNSAFSAVAIKAYSMEILYRLARIYPELAHELSATINMLRSEGSAGIIARGRIILKKLASDPEGCGSSLP
jgi:8-oxo-dGTP diphosphatase